VSARRPAPDQAARDLAVRTRGANVLVDAGAGTGKTTLLVDRILELVAPRQGGAPLSLERIAAITFTRKAAGELKLRLREALLRARAEAGLEPGREALLARALASLDTAWVGTIHGFADRLLRLRPVEARLSPAYDVVEDGSALHGETFDLLMEAVERGTLADEVEGAVDPARAAEAEAAVADALAVGLRAETREHAYGAWIGLDALFARLVETRDAPPLVAEPGPPDLGPLRRGAAELARLAEGCAGDGAGSRHVRRLAERLARLASLSDPVRIGSELLRLRAEAPRNPRLKVEFRDDPAGWRGWKAWIGDDSAKDPVRSSPLRDEVEAPFVGWLARRLVRCAPVAVALHDAVKRRHGALDQVDLLLRLRDLLRDRKDVRAELGGLFDEILVDEFQDTDPLQAEIVLYLCERGARADRWRDVELLPGKLTVVGDPKQSIYRFRRADIEVYAAVRELVRRGPHVEVSLQASFRCASGLVAWLNDRFDALLGAAGTNPLFDPARGTVANVPLLAGRGGAPDARVVTIPIAADAPRVDRFRAAEARALAAFLRATVDGAQRRVADPVTGELRPLRFGDVAILAAATTRLPLLFAELDRLAVPYAVRGSRLFLEDPLHRQLLLALRALADRDDGVARAALLRAPFFAIDLGDVARAAAVAREGQGGAAAASPPGPGVLRVRAALDLVAELRRRRLERSPGETARDLVERTAFARTVALGANGAQRLEALHELCLALDALAAEGGLDFDGATRRARAWVTDPVELDPPRPVGAEAVQILSVHQAKGLEFPAVLLWDSCAALSSREDVSPFAVSRDGDRWALALDGFAWSEPVQGQQGDFAARERRYRDAERLRLVYVAATRARDLLVLPVARSAKNGQWVNGRLAEGAPPELVETLEVYALAAEPAWAAAARLPGPADPGDASALAAGVEARWAAARADAARPRLAPTSVTAEAHRDEARPHEPDDEGADDEGGAGSRPPRPSRFGRAFGETVHRAIGLALADPALAPAEAIARAAAAAGLEDGPPGHRAEAAEDVARALAALEAAGLRRAPGDDLRLEYPVALALDGGAALVQGYLDLLGVRRGPPGRLAVLDFKTDAPPGPGADVATTHPAYVAQVRAYARLVADLGLAAPGGVEAGLLFTADGAIRWV